MASELRTVRTQLTWCTVFMQSGEPGVQPHAPRPPPVSPRPSAPVPGSYAHLAAQAAAGRSAQPSGNETHAGGDPQACFYDHHGLHVQPLPAATGSIIGRLAAAALAIGVPRWLPR